MSRSAPYRRLRIQLLLRCIARIRTRAGASLLLLAGLLGPALLGLIALTALPPLFAATLPPLPALGLLAAHATLLALPLWCLRAELLPPEVLAWQSALPLSRRERLASDALVVSAAFVPLLLLHALSLLIWLVRPPDWLAPIAVRATLDALASLAAGAVLATLVLSMQSAPARPARRRGRLGGPPALLPWQALLLRPLIAQSGAGCAGLGAACLLASSLWLGKDPFHLPREIPAFTACALWMGLTLLIDARLVRILAGLQPIGAAWPLAWPRIEKGAKRGALLPILGFSAVCAALAGSIGFPQGRRLAVFAAASFVAHATICFQTRPGSRGRVAAAAIAVAALGVIASLIQEI